MPQLQEFDIAHELEHNVRQVQEELAAYKRQREHINGAEEMAHAELLRMKEEVRASCRRCCHDAYQLKVHSSGRQESHMQRRRATGAGAGARGCGPHHP